MSSTPFHRSTPSSSHTYARPAYPAATTSSAPPGTFAPGTKVQVGAHRVVIEKYLSEGGFAHVYTVRVPRDASSGKYDVAVLKRVAVPDKEALASMRTEVETMKKLKGHRHIVTYMDSHASQLKGGGYEVFLLMEFCAGGGLIDFMNTRLQHRLTEPEILHIFCDVAEGVAAMHYLRPPLLHRDLKVENVLISSTSSSRTYKLCDFGSAAVPRPAAKTAQEGRLIEEDVQKHTTMQYRSPEMIDVYRKLPIDEKSDIWALGVLLYKLCYYTTPFEEQGQMAILNASYKFPHYPSFSDRIKKLIAWMLREHPSQRPNIYQVVKEVCSMRGKEVPIKDIYANRTESEGRRYQELPSREPKVQTPPVVGLQKAAPVQKVQSIPEVTPMRRGRPTAPTHNPPAATARPSPSPLRVVNSDPFAALDTKAKPLLGATTDELSSRFPSLDEFSILHDHGGKFQFSQESPKEAPGDAMLQKRVTHALADDAFAKPAKPAKPAAPAQSSTPSTTPLPSVPPVTQTPKIVTTEPAHHYVSVAVGTDSPPPSPPLKPALPRKSPSLLAERPIWRVPRTSETEASHHRAVSQPRSTDTSSSLRPGPGSRTHELHRSKSQITSLNSASMASAPAASGRPGSSARHDSPREIGLGVETEEMEIQMNGGEDSKSKRPGSIYVESNIDFLRDRESGHTKPKALIYPSRTAGPTPGAHSLVRTTTVESSDDENAIELYTDRETVLKRPNTIANNLSFLRSIEHEDKKEPYRSHRRRNSEDPIKETDRERKRTSLPHVSSALANTKHILAGKFGDAFRRFETNTASGSGDDDEFSRDGLLGPPPHSPDPSSDYHHKFLTPIAGSEATVSDQQDRESAIDETVDLSPEVRRELERRRLSQEEKRVEAAAREYRERLAQRGPAAGVGSQKSSMIQDRMRNLMEDSQKDVTVRTAEGYGHFSDDAAAAKRAELGQPQVAEGKPRPAVGRKPVPVRPASGAGAAVTVARTGGAPRPSVAPKPRALRTGNAELRSTGPGDADGRDDDWEANFEKKYPSLSGLEMVETKIEPAGGAAGRR